MASGEYKRRDEEQRRIPPFHGPGLRAHSDRAINCLMLTTTTTGDLSSTSSGQGEANPAKFTTLAVLFMFETSKF